MQYTNEELRELLHDEIDRMFGNLDIRWRPRSNAALFEELLKQQYDVWLQEIANTLFEIAGCEIPIAFDGESVVPAQWLNAEDNFDAERVICQDNTPLCKAMNRSWYNVLHIINLHCLAIQEEIAAWWDAKRQRNQ